MNPYRTKPRRQPEDSIAPAPRIFRIGAISAGDIVFVYNQPAHLHSRVKRSFNVVGQRILASIRKLERLSLAPVRNYSHVMLGVGGGLVIHADGKTVSVDLIPDALHFSTTEASLFQVYRLKDFSQDKADKVVRSAVRYYSQRYSFTSYFTESDARDTTQFCSKLVAHAYRTADLPLTSLPDNRVLPLDLYRICQSDAWEDVSAGFLQEAPSPDIDKLLSPIEIEGQGKLSVSEFLARADAVLVEAANNSKKVISLQHDTTRNVLRSEALLAQFVLAQFDLSKKLRVTPAALDEKDAFRIARVLEQLTALLELSKMPSIDLLVPNTFLNTHEDETNTSLYAGYPPPLAIREMQRSRESLRIYDYLLLAEIGLLTILAHRTPHEKFEQFRAVKTEYADRFAKALPVFEDFAPYEANDNSFLWVERENDRATCREIFSRILSALQVIALLRSSGMSNSPEAATQ